MFLEEKIKKLNHNTKSRIRISEEDRQDGKFQQSCTEAYLNFLRLEDEKKSGFKDVSTSIEIKNEGTPNECVVKEVKNIVWTDHGPLLRIMETGVYTQGCGFDDKYNHITIEGYFLMPPNPSENIPPRYEYTRVVKGFYYNARGEVTSDVQGFVKVDDQFCNFTQAVEQRGVSADSAFELFEGQANGTMSLAQSLPLPVPKPQDQNLINPQDQDLA